MQLETKSPEYWAREAPLGELTAAAFEGDPLTDDAARILDFAYVERAIRMLGRARAESRDDALALADHLERVAHDTARADLERLAHPYFARWRTLSEILHRYAARLDVPSRILDRRHVREVLLHLHGVGGRAPQGELSMIANEGQRSALLKLMEQWELIERRADGQARVVSITELGRLAIAADIARAAEPKPGRLMRGSYYMYEPPVRVPS